ncbi:MAG: class I SAM-dependent methyltransferase [Hyphomicrobiaceae bacterium]
MLAVNAPLRCVVCGGSDVRTFFDVSSVPTYCNVLWETRREALASPRGAISLGMCQACGHIFNHAFEPARVAYSVAYENSLHFSQTFEDFAQSLALHLIGRYDLRNRCVIDVGCGKGDFLATLCELGGNRGWGFDASYSPEGATHSKPESVTFVREFFSSKHADINADLVCCRHVLEHIEDPRGFVREIGRAIRGRPNATVYFEVPNALFTLRDLGIWDIIYEHCSYFTAASLERLFADAGFNVLDVRETYHGQFLSLEARYGEGELPSRAAEKREVAELVVAFEARFREVVSKWSRSLESWGQSGRSAVVWGGGSKGVTFLNVVGAASGIDRVVDINPRKHGKFVAGTGQEVVPPGSLLQDPPDDVILMNPVYAAEVAETLRSMGLAPEIHTPMPEVLGRGHR